MNMSIDKVIEILDSGKAPETEQDFVDFDTAIETAINLLKTHHDSQLNAPLTLEQLREMDGEPVYFQFGDGAQGWGIVEIDVDSIVLYGPDFDDHAYPDGDFINMEYNDPAGHFGLHLLGWRAYRRKPEEGTT